MIAALSRTVLAALLLSAAATTAHAQTASPATTPWPKVTEKAASDTSLAPAADATPSILPTVAPGKTPQITWSDVRVNGPYIAMTFDDGPSAKLTPQLLDLLAQRHIHVTFFVVGQNAKDHPEILKRAVAEGHEIGNHSWSHPNFFKLSDEAAHAEVLKTKEAIAAAIGNGGLYMRPPYGNLTVAQRKWVHDEFGYKIILWSVDPLDWKRPGPDAVHRRIVEATRSGSIILSHDIHAGTVEAMPGTFDELLAKGFKFVTVSELLAMELPPAPKPVTPPKTGMAAKGRAPAATPKPAGPPMPETITATPDAPH